ncbi:hypothetical protein AVEN_57938-1 [Araneus ventricosus]|uniref:Uncharacterized protein n=1 Tax=Araneus ventricosus TaxID=182803 RepID=A0A4Y2NDU5_ARAVE|nr:hypothetical protein AVEN_57938-1 [Araneus ventricosus]
MNGLPQHPFLVAPIEAINSREYKFASGVVTYVMNKRFQDYTHPLPSSSSDFFTHDIRMVLGGYYRRHKEEHITSYNEWFAVFEKSRANYNRFMLRVKNAYWVLPYRHHLLLQFLTEISVYALCMYGDGYLEAPEIAMLIIFDCLWPSRFFWFVDTIPFNQHWKHLEQYCKNTGRHNRENQLWRANT